MRRLLVMAVALVALTGCTPEQIWWWRSASPEDQAWAMDHITDAAAEEYGVDPGLLGAIRECEGGDDPTAANPRSSARGPMQHLLRYWPARAEAVGEPDAPWWDPVTNVRAGAWMLSTQGTTPWAASRRCWR